MRCIAVVFWSFFGSQRFTNLQAKPESVEVGKHPPQDHCRITRDPHMVMMSYDDTFWGDLELKV
jgi:hypothetical protein